MRNLIYFMGIASFLACMIFTVATSLTNPFYGMSESALGQATTYISTSNSGETTSFTYSINPYMYEVYDGNTTYSMQKKKATITPTGSASVGFKGYFGVSGSVTVNPEERVDVLKVDLGDQVNCIHGGYKECYKTAGKPTKIYY